MCLHMSLPMTTMGNYCPTLVDKKRSISPGWVAICVFRLLPCSNSAAHSLQLNLEPYFTMCILLWWLLWLTLHTKVLSHSAHGGLWFQCLDCLCLANLFLEVNLSSHWAHSTLLTSLWAAALCSRAWSRLLKAWPQILHILQAAGLKCCVRWVFKWVVVVVLKSHWSHWSHWLHCEV